MADRKHTPGPWFVGRRGYNTAGIEVGPRYPNGPGIWSIAYVEDEDNDDLPADEQDANARLIAAAPDLLAACKALLVRLAVKDRQLAGHRIGRMPQKVFDDLDKTVHAEADAAKAIAKAKGDGTTTSLRESSDVPSTGRED